MKKERLTLHIGVSTLVFTLLMSWLKLTNEIKDLDPVEIALGIQLAVFTIMFFFYESISITTAMKNIEKLFGIEPVEPESLTKTPKLKDLALIILAVGLGGVLAFIMIVMKVNMDSLVYYIGIFGVGFIWLIHMLSSYLEFKKT